MCRDWIIEIWLLAYMQSVDYWFAILLMCNGVIIESIFCFCAIANLFIRFFAHVH